MVSKRVRFSVLPKQHQQQVEAPVPHRSNLQEPFESAFPILFPGSLAEMRSGGTYERSRPGKLEWKAERAIQAVKDGVRLPTTRPGTRGSGGSGWSEWDHVGPEFQTSGSKDKLGQLRKNMVGIDHLSIWNIFWFRWAQSPWGPWQLQGLPRPSSPCGRVVSGTSRVSRETRQTRGSTVGAP